MKIVVIGGTGLIGSKVVAGLREEDNEVVSASPESGVDTLTGEGLPETLEGAEVVIDVSNSPSLETEAALEFFTTSTTNTLAAERDAGVRHHVALSVVGSVRMPDSGYMRAKVVQEKLIGAAVIPYSLVRATQFFEFGSRIADAATEGGIVRLSNALIQPIAADDVAAALVEISQRAPADGVIEIAGPEVFGQDDFVRQTLKAKEDPRRVIADPDVPYFGAHLEERTLLPTDAKHLGEIRLGDWLTQPERQAA